MKLRTFTLLLLSIMVITAACKHGRGKQNPTLYQVNGTLLISHDYCGGARPSDEQLTKNTYPVEGTTLYVCHQTNGDKRTKYFDSIVCDSSGNFTIKLATGNYCFVQKWRAEPLVMPVDTEFEIWDTACYREDYNKSDFILNVKGNTSDVKITLRRFCSWSRPCCNFKGPFPPSAPPTNRGGNQPGHQE